MPKVIAGLVVASLLAACSSNGMSVPAAQGPMSTSPTMLRAPASSPYIIRDASGHVAHIMLSREGALMRPHATSNLSYHNGPVQRPVQSVYLIFWGNWQSGGDPNGAATRLTNFFSLIGGSQWNGTVTQYYDTAGNIANPTGQLAGTWYDTASVPSKPSQSSVAAEAAKAAVHFGNYSVNTSYFIAMPTGHDPSGFKRQWCAFHSDTSTSSGTVSYTDFPYTTDAGASCGSNSVNAGSAGTLDGVTIVGGHEYAETETDPQPSTGWVDPSGSEIGDKCAWVSLKNNSYGGTTLGTNEFPNQPLWSNAISGCAQ
jgi:hypothetical protein